MNPDYNQMPPRQEEKQEERKNGNTVLLTIIGVATLLVALVGATFAYFTAQADNTKNQSVVIKAGRAVDLTYSTQKQISIQNVRPGDPAQTGKFIVKNTDTQNDYIYDLDVVIATNTFNQLDGTGQLTLRFTASTSGGSGTSNTPSLANFTTATDVTAAAYKTAGAKFKLVNDQKINKGGEIHTYDSTLTFVDTNSTQNSNQGQTFAAHVDISDIRTVN